MEETVVGQYWTPAASSPGFVCGNKALSEPYMPMTVGVFPKPPTTITESGYVSQNTLHAAHINYLGSQ